MISHGKDMKIFTGNANPALAQEICKLIGIKLGEAEVKSFADGEASVSLYETVRGSDVFLINSTCKPVNDSLMELLIMIDACRRASAGRINGYVGEINGITAAFNNDCMADANTRGARATQAASLRDRLVNEYIHVRDEILVANDSRYKAAQGDLIGMYRLLATYAGVVHSSWQYAGNPDTVNTGIDAIRRAQGAELAEFQQVYGRFSL